MGRNTAMITDVTFDILKSSSGDIVKVYERLSNGTKRRINDYRTSKGNTVCIETTESISLTYEQYTKLSDLSKEEFTELYNMSKVRVG